MRTNVPYIRRSVRHKQVCTRVESGEWVGEGVGGWGGGGGGGRENLLSPCPDRGRNPGCEMDQGHRTGMKVYRSMDALNVQGIKDVPSIVS